jgi:hypothetical protein
MQSKNNSQQKARLIVVSVFIIGFAAGALSLNLYQRLTSSSSEKIDPRDRTGVILKRMNDKMDLTADQQARIKDILDNTGHQYLDIRKKMEPWMKDFEPQFDAVRQQGREEIRKVLTEKQLPAYQEMVAEQDRIRQEEKEKLTKK